MAAMIILAGSAFTFLAAPGWQIIKGYSIAFSIGSEGGIFKDFSGNINFDDQNPATGKFDVAVNVASVNTGNGLQNNHVKSDEWLDAAKYPTIRFLSTSIAKAGTGYQVTGDLDMHGVKKQVSIPFTFKRTDQGGLFAGTLTVSRKDFNVGKPGGDVDDEIKVTISVPVSKN